MRRILLILTNDVKRRLKSPVTILVLLAIPIVMTAIMGMVFGPSNNGNAKMPKVKVLVVDNDQNIGSRFLLGTFDAEEVKDMFQVTRTGEAEGRRLMAKGKASALIIIPDTFTTRLLKAEPVALEVVKNPSQQFLPEIVEEFMVTMSVVVSGMVQVFEPELKAVDSMVNLDLEQVTVPEMVPFMEQARDKLLKLKKYLSPLLIDVKTESTVQKKEEKESKEDSMMSNIFALVLPGLSILFILFIIEIFMRDILTEREDGKLQRIMFSPTAALEFILARIVSGWLMGIAVSFVMVVFGGVVFNISWGNYLYLLIFIMVTSFWIAAFFALLNAFFKNKNQAGAWTSPVILVFSAFGGSILPVNQLPQSVRWVSDLTLNQWFIKGVQQIMTGRFPVTPTLVVGATGLLLFLFATLALKKRITV